MKYLVFFLWAIPAMLFSQKVDPLQKGKLKGDIYLMLFFIDTVEEEWMEEDVEEAMRELENAQQWILSQAKDYNVEIRFHNDYFDTAEEILVMTTHDMGDSFKLFEKTMQQLGHYDYRTFFKKQDFDFENENICALFFVKHEGRSHAFGRSRKIPATILYPDNTIIRFKNKPEIIRRSNMKWSTIAHEFLHLFGAKDLYDRYDNKSRSALPRYLAKKAQRLWPNSIMLSSGNSNLKIDEYTTYLIGWNKNYQDVFAEFGNN